MMGATHRSAGVLFALTGAGTANALLHLGLTTTELVAVCAIGYVAGELPDLDHRDSSITHSKLPILGKLRRVLWRVPVVGELLASLAPVIIPVLSRILLLPIWLMGMVLRRFYRHRGPTHSLSFAVVWSLLALPLYWCYLCGIVWLLAGFSSAGLVSEMHRLGARMFSEYPLVAGAIACGYLSHLVADGCTNVPLPFLWPLSQRRSSLLPVPLRVTTDSWRERWLVRPLVIGALGLAIVVFVVKPALGPGVQHALRAQVSSANAGH
jgi:membrane-bound metal-dependent hydrolase YbcI (DUF457 family)